MNTKTTCGSCGETKGFVVSEALVPNYEFSNSIEPLTLTAANLDKEKRVPVKLSARVCGGCGRVELFVKDLAVLERFATLKVGNVTRS